MLNITSEMLSKLDDNMLLNKHKFLNFLAFLMFVSGVLFFLFPYISSYVTILIIGVVFMSCGIVLSIALLKNRLHNFWSVVSGILVSIAYILMGYFFITAPVLGIFTIATFLACLFCLGGVIRLAIFFKFHKVHNFWLLAIIGILDLFIAWCFLSATPQDSIYMVSMVIGFELIFSAISCVNLANLFRKS